jgi:predicted small integral membrane protein
MENNRLYVSKIHISLIMRLIKSAMVASIALFFSLVGFNNIADYPTNYAFVQHVTSMDTTFLSSNLMYRAVTNPAIQRVSYWLIIFWQLFTALMCWIGFFVMLLKIKAYPEHFNRARTIAFIGLFLGFILYIVGFIIIGGEWFNMWQSHTWNGQITAGLFVSLIMFIMIFLHQEDGV